MDAMIGQ